MITAVSYSRLGVYEECPQRALWAFAYKYPEPPKAPPPPGKEHANERGSRVHETAEHYVRGSSQPCIEMDKFMEEFKALREAYRHSHANSLDLVELEEMWCFDRDWCPTAWNDWERIWLRIKTDATLFLDDRTAVVIDYKTGKRYQNEVKHNQQLDLYAVGAFMRYTDLQEVTVELWYLDIDDLISKTYTREEGIRQLNYWTERLAAVTSAEEFPPKPSTHSCRFCPYKTGPGYNWTGTGQCDLNPS